MDSCDSQKVFSNGDIYVGNFKGFLPHGKGKYIWSDGTAYEGSWEGGKITGNGKMIWLSGATFEGEFSGGYLHGYGTFTSADGSVYRGAWRLSLQHGIGRKQYSNSDIYDGSWKEGLPEGRGGYVWKTGTRYIGNWKSGKMCGRGVMQWENGDLFDGSWLNGLRHGSGCYRFADGSYYFGTWTKNLKDGRGTYYPARNKHISTVKWSSFSARKYISKRFLSHSSSMSSVESLISSPRVKRSISEKLTVNGSRSNLDQICNGASIMNGDWSVGDSGGGFSSLHSNFILSQSAYEGQTEVNGTIVYEREYMQGVLIKERATKCERRPHKSIKVNKFQTEETRKKSGANDAKKSKSYNLMLNLQLGIRYTVGKITPVPMRKVRDSDFGAQARIRMHFPRKGSQLTPPHYSVDFYWKDYCPMVFRMLREMFKLDAAEYMMSICGDDGLRELSSPGKSGSFFYLSKDDRFVIKTLRRYEVKTLLKMLPSYYKHIQENENTLITKFFGLHRITWGGGKKVRFVVMGNMFLTELRIHRRFDLKGSRQGRLTSPDKISENPTLKDLDLSYEFEMDKLLRGALFDQIHLDCKFLESQDIIDYSLLLGLHFRAPDHLTALLEPPDEIHKHENLPQNDGFTSSGELLIPPNGLMLVTHEPSSVSTAPGPHIRGNTLRAYSVGDKEVDLLLPGTGRLRVQLGVNMPAKARRLLKDESNESDSEVELFEVYDVVLYLGIIDILQEYNMKKKVEHACKSMRYDPMSISAVETKVYSKRFIDFLERVFPISSQ
ncbi:phosphatidylinositol 4-phosphate 5-kinase 8-like [Impatiens glandulifera]|uniref:phosphatidylinositol 4-phosphate 5-kinase 8-like n=1 Tax=Impatiens glandulifera TaxID=253017 RepID=UPI001FB0ED67|nr:phosphatidylinositol 4-phosphate 5-kinase 8-like [Impatiens glandulifera]XP_047337501.1 phosphatidylinositol 4-phosphate 5-kinase 8-like [Impatiens glandulifera]